MVYKPYKATIASLSTHQKASPHNVTAGVRSWDEWRLKLLMISLFFPVGTSIFIGDFRFSPVRVLIILFSISATFRFISRINSHNVVIVPSDIIVMIAGIWMIISPVFTDGIAVSLKSGGSYALEFTGAYFVFRNLLGRENSSTKIIKFSIKVIIAVVAVALLDTLTQTLFTYQVLKGLTGYDSPWLDQAVALRIESIYRDGSIRAMGPLEHSILFGAVCAWFATLAICTFPTRLLGRCVVGIAFLGILASQARAPLLAYFMGLSITLFYFNTRKFRARWKMIGLAISLMLGLVYFGSQSPISTLLRLGGINPEAAWYREEIWATAIPVVLRSPLFGIGLTGDWGWQNNEALFSSSVDSFWLSNALMFGIPGSVLIFLTMVSAFWLGSVDKSPFLSDEEQRLSVALGIVISTAVFLGFTVHFWGACWILLGVFPGIRANLAEAAILRRRADSQHPASSLKGVIHPRRSGPP